MKEKDMLSALRRERKVLDCVICFKPIGPIDGWWGGANANPISEGKCCERCDREVVTPARVFALREEERMTRRLRRQR